MKKPVVSSMQLSLFDEPFELSHEEQQEYVEVLQENAVEKNDVEIEKKVEASPPLKETLPIVDENSADVEMLADIHGDTLDDYNEQFDVLNTELEDYEKMMELLEVDAKVKQPENLTEEEQIKKTVRTLKQELKIDFMSNDPDMTREEIKEEEEDLVAYIKENYDVDGHYIKEPTDRMFLSINAREQALQAHSYDDVNLADNISNGDLKELMTAIEAEENYPIPNVRNRSKAYVGTHFDSEGNLNEELRDPEAFKDFVDGMPNALKAVLRDYSEAHNTSSDKYNLIGFGAYIKEEEQKIENFLTASKNMSEAERLQVVEDFEPKTEFVKGLMDDIEESVLLDNSEKLEAQAFVATIYDEYGLPKADIPEYEVKRYMPESLENPMISMATATKWDTRRDPELHNKLKTDVDVTTLPHYKEWMLDNNLKEMARTTYLDARESGVAEEMAEDRRQEEAFNAKLNDFNPTNEKLKLVWEEIKETDKFYDFEKQEAQNFIMDNFYEDGTSKNEAENMEDAPHQLVQIVMHVDEKNDMAGSAPSSDFDVIIEEREQELKENHDFDADKTLEDMLQSFGGLKNETIDMHANEVSNDIEEPTQEVNNNASPSNRF